MGRPRSHNPAIPAYIDQAKIPRGAYFDGSWYVFERDISGRAKRRRIASRDARLSELHAAIESLAGVDRHSLNWLLDQFHKSETFRDKLGPRTQSDYEYQRKIVRAFPLKNRQTLGELAVARLSRGFMQQLIDSIGRKTPTKANHLLRYLRRVFRWGMNRDLCAMNPCTKIEAAKERRARPMPTPVEYDALLVLARKDRPYLWAALEIGYLTRLRGVEVATLTDAHVQADGLRSNRRKGSRDNVTEWTPRLRAAVDALIAWRNATWAKKRRPVPLRAEDRPLVVSQSGRQLTVSGLQSAFKRILARAHASGVVAADQKFGMHSLKRRGITDTPGTRHAKQQASGHRDAKMVDVYDSSVPLVPPSAQ